MESAARQHQRVKMQASPENVRRHLGRRDHGSETRVRRRRLRFRLSRNRGC